MQRGGASRPRNIVAGGPTVERIEVSAYTIPTDHPEADGTLEWQSTTLVVVHAAAGGVRGLGFTYADVATARVIEALLADIVRGCDAMAVPQAWAAMVRAIRNLGRPGIASAAIAAVDIALWDLKARLLDVPLVTLLGPVRNAVPVYGSGGFTSYSVAQLQTQLAGWAADGIAWVKMKVGRDLRADARRVRAARAAIGRDTGLFVDANGAYARKQGLEAAELFRTITSPGSRSRSLRTISTACGSFAIGRRPGWPSPRASTATTKHTSDAC